MRILFIAALHHPEQLRAARLEQPSILFPPSMHQHFWEKALTKRGHSLAVFYRNLPMWERDSPRGHTVRHSEGLTPRKLIQAAWTRVPARVNPDYWLRNRALRDQARAFKPHVVWMVGGNNVIYPETLDAIKRETGAKLVLESGDSPLVFSRQIEQDAAPLVDIVLVNDAYHGDEWLQLGAKMMIALPSAACDPDFHRPYELTPDERAAFACDVAFIGTLVPDHLYSRRVRALNALSAAGFNVGIWSVHDVPPTLRKHVRGAALGQDMQRILGAASICFNTHGDTMRYGGNQRLFEVAGAGVFQITDDLPGVRGWFPNANNLPTIITYQNLADLCEKTDYYLSHPDERAAIAANSQRYVYAHHTYDQRAAHFEQLIQKSV